MPSSAVKTPEQEAAWKRAKAKAVEQGHAGDWDYVMEIYQRMAGLKKSFVVPAQFRGMRVPGQVPARRARYRSRTRRAKPAAKAQAAGPALVVEDRKSVV